MLTDAQTQFVTDVLFKARTDQQVKLRLGLRLRQKLVESIGTATIDKEHYRYKWLTETRNKVIELLGSEAKAFNVQHPHDAISVSDLIDVTESALLVLKANS